MSMTSDSDDDGSYDSETKQAFETSALLALRRGDLEFAIRNFDGSLRCPICSPAKRKQSYAYKDLLIHAKAVAETGHRGPEIAGKHSAVKIFLENDLKDLAPPIRADARRIAPEDMPQRIKGEEKLVFPWTVIVLKMLDRAQEAPVGFSKKEILTYFAEFNPVTACIVRSRAGPQPGEECCAFVQFERGLDSLDDALALENYFVSSGQSRREYNQDSDSGSFKEGFYGWLARADDHHGRGGFPNGELIATSLQSCSDLRDIKAAADEILNIYKLQLKNLRATLETKSQDAMSLQAEMGVLQHQMELERHQYEEDVKPGISADWRTGCRIL